MSKLEETDYLNCSHCSSRMNEVLLCISRANRITSEGEPYKKRCPYPVCEDCKYCMNCEFFIQQIHLDLKVAGYGKKSRNNEKCQVLLTRLKDDHDIVLE